MGIVDITKQKSSKLDSVFERVRDDVMAHMTNTMPTEVVEWFRCNLDFNVPQGKPDHILSVVDFVEILRGQTLSDDEYFKAALLQCQLQASRLYVYSKDLPNKPHNQQRWYAGDDIVIKDSFWLDVVMYHLLKKYFRTESYYIHLLELFHDTTFQTEMGHLVNLITASKDHVDLDKFSLQRYGLITRSHVTRFYLPVALAMCLCGISENYTIHGYIFSPYTIARSILLQLAEYSHVQDDFLNYVGMVEDVDKSRAIIADNKCSWCINVALVVVSPQQRKVLEDNYGRTDPEKEMRVKEIYETIGLKELYRIYEVSLRIRIEASIAEIPEPEGSMDGNMLKRQVFARFFNEIRKGTK